ncbi:MAG: ErfK/YbiS/YcfS/YnhG family protein [Actinoallomurus sp.]|nr:ErfK/YbiS/YcfS/YnhG family protein [Actinoallomurus sp.]
MSNRFTRARPARTALSYVPVGGSRSLMVGAATAAAAAMLLTGCGGKSPSPSAGSSDGPQALAKLPQATTYTSLKGISEDTDPLATSDGTVVHPTNSMAVSATAGGPPVATLPSNELGSPTWVPVVETKPGWQRVLLPSRPNGATGWIATGNGKVQTARSSYVVKVNTATRRLTLLQSGHSVGTWTVAVGAPKTPTPAGRTFILASLAPAKATYSPLILPLGVHSQTLDTFGGGPGTVAFHGWPQKAVFGQAVTHGCVRVPSDALTQLSKVPLGTPVFITN